MELLNLALRWLHVLSAVILVGGLFYVRFAVLPALESLPEAQREKTGAAMRSSWAKFIMLSISLLLITGLVNMIMVPRQNTFLGDDPDAVRKHYAMLVGIKFVLALPIFFFVSVLNGRSPNAERFRQKSRLWLNVTLALSIVVICLAGYIRFIPRIPKSSAPPVPSRDSGASDTSFRQTLSAAERVG